MALATQPISPTDITQRIATWTNAVRLDVARLRLVTAFLPAPLPASSSPVRPDEHTAVPAGVPRRRRSRPIRTRRECPGRGGWTTPSCGTATGADHGGNATPPAWSRNGPRQWVQSGRLGAPLITRGRDGRRVGVVRAVDENRCGPGGAHRRPADVTGPAASTRFAGRDPGSSPRGETLLDRCR